MFGNGYPLKWSDATTENPGVGDTEVWEIYNFTADAHPIHIHLIQFQVIDRQALDTDADGNAVATTVGAPRPRPLGPSRFGRGPWRRGEERWPSSSSM